MVEQAQERKPRAVRRGPPPSLPKSGNYGNGSKDGEQPAQRPRTARSQRGASAASAALAPQPPAAAEAAEDAPMEGEEVEEEEGRRRRRRGGGRAHRGQHTGKSWTSKDNNLHSSLLTLMTLALQNTQRIRLMMCAVADTCTMKIARPIISHITEELEGFRERVNGLRSAKDKEGLKHLGPPTPALALAMLEGLQACEVGGRVGTQVDEYLEKCQPKDHETKPTIDMDQINDQVHFIRVEKTADPTSPS
ncbi:unnamed protein product [Prorocentrum cordatum]|uniref:Uncharacterized protein n=1 Tax=Prorocentrum cordatum TaxID=2364126 RepID=A0ABN9TQA0_9DINO|nr:unnamed protein product [Polarella glacialis]